MDDQQVKKIIPLANQYPHDVHAAFTEIHMLPTTRDLAHEARKEQIQAQLEKEREIGDEYGEKLDEILLPFQRKRINQLAIQIQFAKPTFVSVFKAKEVAEAAELSKSEARELAQVAAKAEAEYLVELRELKRKHHQKVRASFSPEVRAAIEEILGAPYITVPEIKKTK